MASQAALRRGCILTLVALVWFPPNIICVSQGNIYIGPTFTKFNIYKMLTHHHREGNVVPCVMSLSKLFKPIEAQYCSSEFPIWTENKLLNWSEWQYTFTFTIKIWVNGNQLSLSQWELFNKLGRPPPPSKKKKKREAILRLPHPDTLHFDYFALWDYTTSWNF